MRVWPGAPYPLGATWDGEGVNFAVFTGSGTGAELCLFEDPNDGEASARVTLREQTDRVFHAYLPDLRPGALYGLRVSGPYQPEEGQRHNEHKLLLDPYAKAITGDVIWGDEVYGYRRGDPGEDLVRDDRDSAKAMPKCVVVDTAFTWGDDAPPRTAWNDSIIYECHVRGMTMLHPLVPDPLRGTYLGLCAEPVLDHLTSLGVTAVELLPVHHYVNDHHLVEKGLSNYWGYNSIGFFAPEARYATRSAGEQVHEFKTMVKRLHGAGLEVILDVVYNHTGEGSRLGPTLELRGIDNRAYYRLSRESLRYDADVTGTGNSLNLGHEQSLALVLDSLRYWAEDMHVDGFRFDLAATLMRGEDDQSSAFLQAVNQDPVLSRVKLIAEPWDLGPDGYRLGRFPRGWAEWNGQYRDTVRRYWRGDRGLVPALASRLSGSSDIFAGSGRQTYASLNFVTCHDGFTLTDLVSYNERHNEANLEGNADGSAENFSRNWGEEGATESTRILNLRTRIKKNLLATLMFSQGTRMLLGGDEIGRTQHGNNNAYCQDNEVSWVNWNLDDSAKELLAFTSELVEIVKANPVLRRRRFFSGTGVPGNGPDVMWVNAHGEEMTSEDWGNDGNQSIGMLMFGHNHGEVDLRGRVLPASTLLLLLNAGVRSRSYTLPRLRAPGMWEELLNTARPARRVVRQAAVNLTAHSTILLRYDTTLVA